jgi:hypothetical protein
MAKGELAIKAGKCSLAASIGALGAAGYMRARHREMFTPDVTFAAYHGCEVAKTL